VVIVGVERLCATITPRAGDQHMGVYNATGTRQTKAGLPVTAWVDPDPKFTVTARLVKKQPYYGAESGDKVEGTEEQILANAGDVVRQSDIDKWFTAADITSVTPATGGVAGGTVVTVRGTGLDGVTAVTFGGTAGTALTYVSPSEIRVTTPAKAAAVVAVVATDDSGTITEAAAFTFA
jgi:hypothetical protein